MCVDALRQLGFHMEDLVDEEVDAALGNGGLGIGSYSYFFLSPQD